MNRPGADALPDARAGGDRIFEVSAIAFDLDGTLLDTVADLAAAVNATLADFGYPPLPTDAIRAMIGRGLPDLVRRALARARDVQPDRVAGAEVESALVRHHAHYERELGRATQAYPGLHDGLERLATRGFPLAVVTNKARRFVRPHLELAGIAHYFALIVGGDDLPAKKPDPAQLRHVAAFFGVPCARVLMVGDSGNDVDAARAAGCPVLVVPYGYNEGRPVQMLGADGIVPSLPAVADRVVRIVI